MKRVIAIVFALCAAFGVYAQDFEVPDYKLESFSDYAELEGEVLKCANWLINSPPDQNENKRDTAAKFMVEWLRGNAYIHLQFYPGLTDFQYTAHDLIALYIAGRTRYALENKDYNQIRCDMAAASC